VLEINKQKEKIFGFVLKTDSGTVLLNSVDFDNELKAQQAIKNFEAIKTPNISFERKTNHKGEFLFSLKNKNGNLIGNSESYQSEAGMENGIKNLINRIDSL
jgi:uncharacterized protein YegP (UPF0339 family)